MNVKVFFDKIRTENRVNLTLKYVLLLILVCFISGVLFGVVSKYSDTIPGGDGINFSFISNITTHIGMWIFLATIIAVFSKTPKIASLKVFLFFSGVLIGYYFYSMHLFGFFPMYYFWRWGIIAVISTFASYLIWFSRGDGWLAALCMALPIGLLIQQGNSVFYYFSVDRLFDIIFAILLFILIPKNKIKQCLRTVPIIVFIFLIFEKTNILSCFLGGL